MRPLIILKFSIRQLAGPYYIRAAHGPKPFLEMPFSHFFQKACSFSLANYPNAALSLA